MQSFGLQIIKKEYQDYIDICSELFKLISFLKAEGKHSTLNISWDHFSFALTCKSQKLKHNSLKT